MAEFEESIIQGATLCPDQLPSFGFQKENDAYVRRFPIQGGAFSLEVAIAEDGAVATRLFDVETGDEYNLYRMPSAHGEYVLSIREEVKAVLAEVRNHCFRVGAHQSEEFLALTDYFRLTYNEELEYLWDDGENAILRRSDNRKWYAVFMRVGYEKLGVDQPGICSVVAFRGDPSEVDMRTLFPGYHLNKKHWVCMILDGRNQFEDLRDRLLRSREVALGKKKR